MSAPATLSGASQGAKWPTAGGKTSTLSPTSPIPSLDRQQRLVLQAPRRRGPGSAAWARRARPGRHGGIFAHRHHDLASPVPVQHGGQCAGPAPLVDVDLPFLRGIRAMSTCFEKLLSKRHRNPWLRFRPPCPSCGTRAYIGRRHAVAHPRSGSSGKSADAAN